MIDWMTLVMIIIMSVALLITSIYILAYFCHPDDTSSCDGWILKIIVIFGIILSFSQVLVLPLDVSNVRTFGSGINMQLFWYIIYYSIIIYIFIIYPLSVSYYECDPEWTCCQKIKHSLCCFFLTLIIFVTAVVLLYIFFGYAEIPINAIELEFKDFNISSDTFINETIANITQNCTSEIDGKLKLDVSILIYAIGLLTFISWFVFSFFGGIGLAAIPLDFFHDFCTRPKLINKQEISDRRSNLLTTVTDLISLGEDLKDMQKNGAEHAFLLSGKRRNYNRKMKEFRAGFALADEEFYIVNASEEIRKKNNCIVVLYYLLIPFGIITTILSMLWLSQFICVYVLTLFGEPSYPLISNLLLFFEDNCLGFLSFFIFAILCLYLLYCLMKGNIKFGVRIMCCWTVYPMKKNGTYMNAFLFNICLILLGSLSVTEFCSTLFQEYFTFTDIDLLFNVQIHHLKYIGYVFSSKAFEFAFFGFAILSLIILLYRPNDRVDVVLEKKSEMEMRLVGNKYNENK